MDVDTNRFHWRSLEESLETHVEIQRLMALAEFRRTTELISYNANPYNGELWSIIAHVVRIMGAAPREMPTYEAAKAILWERGLSRQAASTAIWAMVDQGLMAFSHGSRMEVTERGMEVLRPHVPELLLTT